jgi:hypothetical protein
MIAGAGAAPAGLKQSTGRAARLDGEANEYEVWDLVDIGEGCENYIEQANRRWQHYEDGGLALSETARERRTPPEVELEQDEESDPDVDRLEQLLEAGAGKAPGQVAAREADIVAVETGEAADAYTGKKKQHEGYWGGLISNEESWLVAILLLIILIVGECSKNGGI